METIFYVKYIVLEKVYEQRTSGPFYKHGLTLIPAWISNHMPNMSVGQNYLCIPKLQRYNRWSLGMDK